MILFDYMVIGIWKLMYTGMINQSLFYGADVWWVVHGQLIQNKS
jgi:hypothetical protein